MSHQDITPSVEYKEIPNRPGYYAGSDGSIWSCRIKGGRGGLGEKWHRLKPWIDGKGYSYVYLHTRPSRATMLVHRLVMLAHVGPCPEGMEVCHHDGDKKNNALTNLRYDTRVSNLADSTRLGTISHGVRRYNAKLNDDIVRQIRSLYAGGLTNMRNLAARFNVTPCPIYKIISGETWKHVK